MTEYKKLRKDGLTLNSVHFAVKISALICDAPARQCLKSIKGHTGYDSCERCTIRGVHQEHRMTFVTDVGEVVEERTTENFQLLSYLGNHQIAASPLIGVVDCIHQFAIDYMHLVLLGVVKRMIKWRLKEGPRICKLSQAQIQGDSMK